MRYNGNVGINTTVPNATLHVVGFTILQAPGPNATSGIKTILNLSNETGGTVCYIDISGNLVCKGTKSAVVDTSFDSRKLYAVESPDVRHIDEGRAKLKQGFANVSIDPIFRETIEGDYNVYITPEGKTKALYVAEKAKDYFIVKDTASTNAIFSYIISAYRRGYSSKRFESGSDIEIVAVIDENTATTEIELSGSLPATETQSSLQTKNTLQTALQTASTAQTTQQTAQNTAQDNSSSAISGAQSASQIQSPAQASSQPNSAAGVTGNIVNEAGLETDLSNILEPASNASTAIGTSTEAAIVFENNASNASGGNASISTISTAAETAQQNAKEQDDNEKFTLLTVDEDEIIKKIEEKTKLDKEKIKRSIKFKKKEPIKDALEEFEEEAVQTAPAQLGYIAKVNGSVIVRLG